MARGKLFKHARQAGGPSVIPPFTPPANVALQANNTPLFTNWFYLAGDTHADTAADQFGTPNSATLITAAAGNVSHQLWGNTSQGYTKLGLFLKPNVGALWVVLFKFGQNSDYVKIDLVNQTITGVGTATGTKNLAANGFVFYEATFVDASSQTPDVQFAASSVEAVPNTNSVVSGSIIAYGAEAR